jgi:hypothetical protein
MIIATWNVNSIANRLEQVLQWLADTKTDILCLQETKCVDEKFRSKRSTTPVTTPLSSGKNPTTAWRFFPNTKIADVQKKHARRRRRRRTETSDCRDNQ